MDGLKFDAWTRRGFGAMAGGLAGSLLALSAIPVAKAKKGKKKKKRCKNLGDSCQPHGSKDKKCCGCLACHPVNAVADSPHHCCHLNGEPCSDMNGAAKCCSGVCNSGFCICKTNGQTCSASKQCCSGFCKEGQGADPDTCDTQNDM